ncbi:DUF4190 domain-containing protein [Gardnerella vaginalis]|uniref:DUF4190 domain-containing protein n=1 Tax=Gardnerella vaginalis TaxID=2702 RepID=A0A2K1STF5_GARVA|nr:DUF4190 domain-containing protein [Gardnerella vaginalis]PNS42817.1 hypothetical protein BFS05_06165 [Gardnerella vaginalis]
MYPDDNQYQNTYNASNQYQDPQYKDPQYVDPQYQDPQTVNNYSGSQYAVQPYTKPDYSAYGYNRGYTNGYDDGYNNGYNNGYNVNGGYDRYPAGRYDYYDDYEYRENNHYNVFAIIGFIFSLIGNAVIGLPFSFVALNQIKRTNEKGKGLATAGVIIGFIWLAFWLVVIVFYIAAIIWASSQTHYYYSYY